MEIAGVVITIIIVNLIMMLISYYVIKNYVMSTPMGFGMGAMASAAKTMTPPAESFYV